MKRLAWSILLLLLALGLPASPRATAAELVTNGGFETGTLAGWTPFASSGIADVGVQTGSPHSGTYGAYLQKPAGSAGFEQSFAAAPNAALDYGFWLALTPVATTNFFTFELNGVVLLSLTNQAAFGYTLYSGSVAGSASGINTIRFNANNANSQWLLDDVSVLATPVPEPASLLLLGGGLLGLAAVRRRRRR